MQKQFFVYFHQSCNYGSAFSETKKKLDLFYSLAMDFYQVSGNSIIMTFVPNLLYTSTLKFTESFHVPCYVVNIKKYCDFTCKSTREILHGRQQRKTKLFDIVSIQLTYFNYYVRLHYDWTTALCTYQCMYTTLDVFTKENNLLVEE